MPLPEGVPDLNELAHAPTPASGLRVLIVDDNEDHAAALCVLVQRWGHDVIMVHTAADAELVMPAFGPHVVLLDLGLPDRHGYDLAEKLRSNERYPVFVAVTGWNSVADQLRSTNAGIRHHLMKPVNIDVLRELLSAYAGMAAAHA